MDSTWSNRNCWKDFQHTFLNDLEAKGLFISRADRQRVKSIKKLYLHTLVPYCRLDEFQDLGKHTSYSSQNINEEMSGILRKEKQMSGSTSCNDCAEWIRRFT